MYRGPVLAATARDSSPTCGPLLPVVPPLSHAISCQLSELYFQQSHKMNKYIHEW